MKKISNTSIVFRVLLVTLGVAVAMTGIGAAFGLGLIAAPFVLSDWRRSRPAKTRRGAGVTASTRRPRPAALR